MQPNSEYESYLRREKSKYLNLKDQSIVLDVGGGSGEVWRCQELDGQHFLHNVEPDRSLRIRGDQDIYSKSFSSIEDVPSKSIPQYDIVTLMGLLEHLDDPLEMLKNLGKAKRIYITVPNSESYHRYVGRELKIIRELDELGPQDLEIGHKRVYSPLTLRHLIGNFNKMFDYKYKISLYTTSFKMFDSVAMMEFADKFVELNAAAERAGIIGSGLHGAEIVVNLERISTW